MSVKQWLSVDVRERLKKGGRLQIIDVREPNEFAEGRLPGARLIPLGQIGQRVREIDPHVDTLVVCRSGARSERACTLLLDGGFDKIYNLHGGMLSWDGEVER